MIFIVQQYFSIRCQVCQPIAQQWAKTVYPRVVISIIRLLNQSILFRKKNVDNLWIRICQEFVKVPP